MPSAAACASRWTTVRRAGLAWSAPNALFNDVLPPGGVTVLDCLRMRGDDEGALAVTDEWGCVNLHERSDYDGYRQRLVAYDRLGKAAQTASLPWGWSDMLWPTL